MELAKRCLDVGVYTNDREGMSAFWQRDAGLPFAELLPLGHGQLQLRHDMNGSIFKLNHAREDLGEEPACGYRLLSIAAPGLVELKTVVDPDGNRVQLLPPGHEGVVGIRMDLAVRDPDAYHDFYGHALGLERVAESTYRCGDSLLRFAFDREAREAGRSAARGDRYLTVQVRSVDPEHRGILARGGREGLAPATLGTVARSSFVRDPDGNWIEVSQRASLVGSLTPG